MTDQQRNIWKEENAELGNAGLPKRNKYASIEEARAAARARGAKWIIWNRQQIPADDTVQDWNLAAA